MTGICRKTGRLCEGTVKDCHFMDALLNRKVVVNELNMHCEFWQICKGVKVVNKKELMQWMLDVSDPEYMVTDVDEDAKLLWFKKAIEQTKDNEVVII